ncbi:MAG: phosphoglycerate dehydrogenase [Planctomycetota bacterium]
MRILITDDLAPVGVELLKSRSDFRVEERPGISREELLAVAPELQALVTRSQTPVDAELLAAATDLRVLCRAAVGVDNIDLEAATERGILVVNCPYDNVVSAAEHTMALLLACCRNLVDAHTSLRNGTWDRKSFLGVELRDKTLGIVGLGKVGSRVAAMAGGFGMRVIAYDPYIADRKFESARAEKVETLEDLVDACDVLTIHTPKTQETLGMIGAPVIARLAPHAIVVNCARGGIVDEDALLEALEENRVAAAGVDVWEDEPATDRPLQRHPRVVMTPHLGANTIEAQARISRTAAEQVIKALDGKTVDHPVNMPNLQASLMDRVAHYAALAEKIGAFGEQYARGRVGGIDVIYQGDLAEASTDLLTMALLKGFVSQTSDQRITYVNARRKAEDRGLAVNEASDPVATDYRGAMKVVFHQEKGTLVLVGTIFDERYPHIVQLDQYHFDIIPDGVFLIMENEDKPGVIGEVGTILGRAGINIARWELGRMTEGAHAIAAIQVDQTVPEATLDRIRKARHVTDARLVRL